MNDDLYSIKMRASLRGRHISGAERLIPAKDVPRIAATLAMRAMTHGKGTPDELNIGISRLRPEDCLDLPALPARSQACASPAEGHEHAERLLGALGVERPGEVVRMLLEAPDMRGAMLVDVHSLERLEPDRERGVRATLMDGEWPGGEAQPEKNHYREALVLASKVANAPYITGEICISDDPDYVTGYVASRATGYVRIERMKEPGDPRGGRIFLYDGPRDRIGECVKFLERQAVMVRGICPPPGFGRPEGHPAATDPVDEGLAALRRANLERSLPPPAPAGALEMSSSDYLGLARHPRVLAAACEATMRHGTCSTGSRLTTGNVPEHGELERALAAFCGSGSCLLFGSGYAANVGAIQALCGRGDVILSDELNHASIIDGCRLSGAEVIVYRHNDMRDLAAKCTSARGRRGLVVSDAVFSMDGDVACLEELRATAARYGFMCMLDEAHALGVLDYSSGAPVSADVVTGSLSKALGSQGGYVRGSAKLVAWLLNRARSFIFSTAPAAASSAAARAALEILAADPALATRLRKNAAFLCACLNDQGVPAASASAIVPVIVGDEGRAVAAAAKLRGMGICVSAIRHPTVARGSARLRLTVTLAHTRDDLARAARAVAEAIGAYPAP